MTYRFMQTWTPNNICQWLREEYGGDWTHSPFSAVWQCGDGKRVVRRVANSMHDENPHTEYWLYGDGTPQRVNFHKRSDDNREAAKAAVLEDV